MMEELKPCPFCGNPMNEYPRYTLSFKRDKKKIYGIYHEICTFKWGRCTCTISQAGASKEEAKTHAFNAWNRRAE